VRLQIGSLSHKTELEPLCTNFNLFDPYAA
jgi:hypothetical protein